MSGVLSERRSFQEKWLLKRELSGSGVAREGSVLSEGGFSVNEECITELERQSKEVEAGPGISYGNFWNDGEERP